MVSKKVAKKTAATTRATAVSRVAAKKAPAKKRPPRRAPQSLDLNQALLAEARAVLTKRTAGGRSIDPDEYLQIIRILEQIAEEITRLIILISSRTKP